MKWYVFAADKQGRCLRGFCPTICESEQQAQEEAEWQCAMMEKYGFSYDHIAIEEG